MPAMTRFAGGLAVAAALLAACRDTQTESEVTTRTSTGEASVSISGDSADKSGVALVRVVNAAPSAAQLVVRADPTHTLPTAEYRKVTAYQSIDRNWVTFQISTSAQGTFEPLATNRELLTDGNRYTLVIIPDTGGVFETRVLRDEIAADNVNVQVRVIHAARGIDEVYVVARGGDTLFEGVTFTTEAGFKTLAPWSGTIEIRSGTGNRLLLTIPEVSLNAGRSYTIVLSRDGTGKLESFRFDDSQVN